MFSAIMYKTSEFNEYGYRVDEEFGLADYEDEYFSAPQVPTVSGCNLPDFVNNSVHYLPPSSEALYPVMSVVHGGTTYYYYPEIVYIIPVCYYVPVSFAYGDPVGYVNPCAVEPNLSGAAEVRCDDACNDPPEDNGIYDSYDCGDEEKVSSAISSYFSYSEIPEKLLDAPVKNDRVNPSSQQTVEIYLCYGGDCKGGKGDTPVSSRNKLPQKDCKKTFDMKEYYFNDCLRIPKSEPRYEEEWEKYYLYQMLGSLKLSILKWYMNKYYKRKKKKVYKRACKGLRLRKKQLKELEWMPHQLDSIREEDPEQDSDEMKVDKTLRRGILKNPKKDLGIQPRKVRGAYRVRFKEEAVRETNKDSQSRTMRGPYRVRLEEGAVKKKVIFEKDILCKKDLDSESQKMSDPHRVRAEEGGAVSRNDICSESPKTGDPCTVRVGDIEVRYAPDRYRVFCLENRHRKRFPSIRKFLARMFGKNPP